MPRQAHIPVPVAILNDTRVDYHHGCSRVMSAFSHLLEHQGCRIVASSPAHTDWRRNGTFLRSLQRSRLLLVNGEGTIHHNRPEGGVLLEAGSYARALGIPAVLMNCSWQQNGPTFGSRLRDFALVAARETRSRREIEQTGQACRQVPDLAFYRHYEGSGDRQGIGVSDSVVHSVALELEHLRSRINGKTVAMEFSKPGLAGTRRFFRGFPGKCELSNPRVAGRLFLLRLRQFRRQAESDGELLDSVATLKLLVTGRFHAVAFAILSRTPVIAAPSNTHKVASLLEDVGLSHRLWSPQLSAAKLAQMADSGWDVDERRSIDSYREEARQTILSFFGEIRRLA